MFDLEGKNLEAIKDSELWSDAKEIYDNIPLKERIEVFSRMLYPERTQLTLEDRLDVLMKIGPDDILNELLTDTEREVLNFVDMGMVYEDICIELGYASKASIVQVMNRIRKKIEEAIC